MIIEKTAFTLNKLNWKLLIYNDSSEREAVSGFW
jgi:hypothetical protein